MSNFQNSPKFYKENRGDAHANSLNTALKIYCLYRFLQISALLVYFFSGNISNSLGKENPFLFLICAVCYFFLCFISLAQTNIKSLPKVKGTGILFIFFIDVLAITAFIHFSGGIQGILGILLVVVVATAGILLQGSLVFFIAALASISIIGEQIYLYYAQNSAGDNFVFTGILGFALFSIALIVQQMTIRLRDSEETVSKQAEQVETLEKINEQIIERMPSGVIVVDRVLNVQFMNTAAWRMLLMPKVPDATPINKLSHSLGRQVSAWLTNPNTKPETFSTSPSGPDLIANFAYLDDSNQENSGTIIFLDDASLMSEQAQKMKLASLGTLTAGIAHEIRNPLGAISHAAQLLHESEKLSADDKRLSDIIQQHSIRMNRIIENVLQLSRQKTNNSEDIELNQWLKNFTKDFKSTQINPIEFQLVLGESASTVKVDSSQLSQVLTNLCENGLRYSFSQIKQRYIQVRSDFDQQKHCHTIDIIDKGPGISAKDAEHIFEPFFTTDLQGSGLGLYIAKVLCENNGSKLSHINMPEGGSCFTITFSI